MKEERKDLKSLAEQALELVDWARYSANEDFVKFLQYLTGHGGRGRS